MRHLVSAIRAVKLYPPNNPVYSQSVKKSHEVLDHFLETAAVYHVGVQKTHFSYIHTPVGKETQLNRAIAQDLFSKGIREIVFSGGVTEDELLELYRALALSSEEMAMKSGIASILWEKNATHIRVTEAGLDEIITTKTAEAREATPHAEAPSGPSSAKKDMQFSRRTLVLGDVLADPAGFGAAMVERAKQTRAENESVEDRLLALYQEAGRTIQEQHPDQSDTLFEGLAQSVLSLEQPYRDGLVAGKLYGGQDADILDEQKSDLERQVPTELQEIMTGRFSDAWNVKQVAVLLKKSSAKKVAPPPTPPSSHADLSVMPIPQDTIEMAREMADYTPEEMESLKVMGEMGTESDIIEASVRTLIFLLSLVKNPTHSAPDEEEISLFSGAIKQLEDMLSYLLLKKDYDLAVLIVQAFHMPADPAFKPRMMEAIKKSASRDILTPIIVDMRNYHKGSSEYRSAYLYLSILRREATAILLELLAEEANRSARISLLDLVKDLGKNQISLLGEHLADNRWYVVRNIVNILAESQTEEALAHLHKVIDHKNVRIRQEVIKGLVSIGGKKAAELLAKFLKDNDPDIQMMAVRSFADLKEIDAEDAKPLKAFLQHRRLKKKEQKLTVEAIKTLGMIGGRDAEDLLNGYTRIRWWRSRRLQMELRDAAIAAKVRIKRREDDGGRSKRQLG